MQMGMRRGSPGEVLTGRWESEDMKLRPGLRTPNRDSLMKMDEMAMSMKMKMTIKVTMMMEMMMREETETENKKEKETHDKIINRYIKDIERREKMKK